MTEFLDWLKTLDPTAIGCVIFSWILTNLGLVISTIIGVVKSKKEKEKGDLALEQAEEALKECARVLTDFETFKENATAMLQKEAKDRKELIEKQIQKADEKLQDAILNEPNIQAILNGDFSSLNPLETSVEEE